MKIYVNAGHGIGSRGKYDPGAIGPTGLREADVTADIARRLAGYLMRAGHTVIGDWEQRRGLTAARIAATSEHVDRLLSIHTNAAADSTAHGLEVLYKVPASRDTAQVVYDRLVQGIAHGSDPYPVADRGIKMRVDLGIFRSPLNAILVEALFISNPREEAMLRTEAWRDRIAWCIADCWRTQ